MAGIPQVITEDRASGAQFISGSLKFDGSKNNRLTKTFASAGNRNSWTWSCWVKRDILTLSNRQVIFGGYGASNDTDWLEIGFDSSGDDVYFTTSSIAGSGTPQRRDPTGWYHFFSTFDGSNLRIYVNNNLDLNYTFSNNLSRGINKNTAHYIGQTPGNAVDRHLDGRLTQCYFIDGLVLNPSDFAYTDPLTNTWRPKKYDQLGPNNGTIWSSYLTSSTSNFYTGAQGVEKAFDGDTSTYVQQLGGVNPNYITFTPSGGIAHTSKVEVYINNAQNEVSYNGGSLQSISSGWNTIATGSGTLTSIRVERPSTNGAAFGAIRIDGVILIDGDTSNMGTNGFYLPMDGNTPIGKDQSGRGNDWTPIGFGGSNSVDKATGAIPVLNTNEAGTVARGVRTDKKTYTVTASGGNYYLDGALKPTLNAYRGSSLIFDYTGAASHPLYLSSLPDGKHNTKAYSVEFSGSGDFLSVPSSSDFDFGSDDCTVECFVYITSHGADKTVIGSWEGTTSWQLSYGADSGNDRFAFMMHDGSSTLAAISSIQSTNYVNQWVHLAGVRHGDWLKVYVNGVFGGERSISGAHTTFNAPLTIGGRSNGNQVTGYVSNVRVVKGTALYTAAFTPPGTTLTNVTGTTLLCCQESNVTTAEVSPGTITDGGFPSSSQSRQPFLYDDNHGNFGLNTLDIDTTKITIPHLAADTLYYYCQNHSGMGSSINVTTDIFKADPYAWKCMFAMASDTVDHSPEINVNSTATSFGDIHTTTLQGLRNLYGHSKKMETGGGFRIDIESTTPEADAKHKFETNDFTLECWFYQDGGNTSWQSLFRSGSYNNNSLGSDGIAFYARGTSLFPYAIVSSSGLPFNQIDSVVPYKKWNHAAWTRQGGVNRIFANGVLVNTFNNSNSWDNRGWEIGDVYTWNGGYQDARIYNGVAKYTESFVVPDTAPDILPDSPSGITGKTNLIKITDGAVSFDGSGDYLTVAGPGTLAASSNWCMECFFYCTGNSSGTYRIMSANESAQAGEYILMRIRLGQYQFSTDVANSQPIDTAVFNKWTHMAFTKEGTTVRGFVDGRKIWETTDNNTVTITNLITGWGYSGEYFPGYISNARFVNGSSVYTADFTPPSAPLTNITNTYLLCCQSTTSASASTVQPSYDITVTSSRSGSVGNLSAITSTGSNYYLNNSTVGRAWVQLDFASTQSSVTSIKFTGGGYYANAKFDFYVNGVLVANDKTTIPGWGEDTITISSTDINSIRIDGADGYAIGAVKFNDTLVSGTIGGIIARGDAAATNFNPFTDDINTIRGQETGYATLNPLFRSGTYSDGNLVQTTTVGNGHYRANIGITKSSGKFYFEYQPIGGAVSGMVGFAEEGHAATNNLNGATAYAYYGVNGYKQGSPSAVDSAYGASYTFGDVIGVAFDSDNNTLEFFKNGITQGVAFTSFPNYPYYPAFSAGSSTNTVTYNVNFGQKPFKFSPPDGFQPLSLSNVQPEKVIIRPDQYVDVSLWSGNGTSQTITGLKHKPDFVWIKKRAGGTARSHQLFDSVRGVYKTLHSDSTSVEDTNTNRLTAFNQDGFAVGGDDGANGSSGTFVGWTWKAGGSNGQFNIDDVGYANASDVNMNVGGLNSYNTDQTWTSGLSGSGSGGSFAEATTRAFDGDKTTRARWTGTSDPVLTASFTAISATKLRVKYHAWKGTSQVNEDVMISVNGGPYVSAVEAGYISYAEVHATPGESPIVDVSPLITGGQVSSVSIKRRGTVSTATGLTIHLIEVDDKILVDSNQTPPNVPATAATGCSVGTKQGFSIVSYTSAAGDGSSTIPHGLSQTPDFVLIKNRDTAAGSQGWPAWHSAVPGSSRYLDSANPWDTTEFSYVFNNIAPDSKVVTVGANSSVSSGNRFRSYGNGDDFIMYCWHNVPGLQKFGKYTANNDANGPYIELGFRPALVVCKSTTQGQPWQVYDAARSSTNPTNRGMQWNNNGVEYNSTDRIDILSNGFKIRAGGATEPNVGTNTYIYCAWAEAPSINLYGAQANAR